MKDQHGRLQKNSEGGPDNVLIFLSSTYFTESLTNLPQEAIRPVASWGGYVPLFLRLPKATCEFTGGSEPPVPLLDLPMTNSKIRPLARKIAAHA